MVQPTTSWRVVAAAAAIVFALAGCTVFAPRESHDILGEQTAPADVDPLGLVGMWKVSGAPGQSGDVWLRLEADDLLVVAECASHWGTWRGQDGHIVADVPSGTKGFCDAGGQKHHWLAQVSAYVRTADHGYTLSDSSGRVVARLTPDPHGGPPISKRYPNDFTRAPQVTDAMRAKLDFPAALPADATAVMPVGRWVPAGAPPRSALTDPYIEFDPSGSWVGSNGCGHADGHWFSAEGGLFAATVNGAEFAECMGTEVTTWTWTATRIGMVGDELTLFDVDGNKLGSLVRDA